MKKSFTLVTLVLLICASFLLATGCSEWVPIAHKGMVLTPEGFKGKVLSQGKHEAWGRDKMILMETKEENYKERLTILCADDLGFGFDVYVRVTPRKNASFKDVVNRMGFRNREETLITLDAMYNKFAKPIVRSVSRSVVSKYKTTGIREARETIEVDLAKAITKQLSDTPLILKKVNTSNFKYPPVVTAAVEFKRKTEIEIATEKATQAKRLLKKKNEFLLAKENYKIETLKAKTIADSILVIADSLADHPEYLEWHRVQNVKEAALGPNNTFIFEGRQFSTSDKTSIMNYKAITDLSAAMATTKKAGK